jgi:hypothetical protein
MVLMLNIIIIKTFIPCLFQSDGLSVVSIIKLNVKSNPFGVQPSGVKGRTRLNEV